MNMIQTLLTSFRLSLAYGINTFIYRLKKLPVLKKLISADWYKNRALKNGVTVCVLLFDFVAIFLKKFLYLGILAALPARYLPGDVSANYVHIVLLFALTGAVMNTQLFDASKEKYYSVVLMRMDPRQFALSDYAFYLAALFASMLPASLVIGRLVGASVLVCLLLPVLTVAAKVTMAGIYLKHYEKTGKLLAGSSNTKLIWITILLSLLLGYGLPALSVTLPGFMAAVFTLLFLTTAAFSIPSFLRSSSYRKIYKGILTLNNILFHAQETVTNLQQQNSLSRLTLDVTSNQSGYDYLNDLFVKRHRKLLTVSARRLFVILACLMAVSIALVLVLPDAAAPVNEIMMNLLPYFVFIMYLINRGSVITQAMFFNCDHSMLAYRFYRQPQAVLSLFRSRLKVLIGINLLPASVLAFGFPILLAASGGTDQWINYLLLPVSIFAMSVFFSVHHLVLYYLLQPYDIHMEQKSHTYALANWATYIVCYLFIQLRMPTLLFASLTIVFCIVYIALALYLVYRYAPRTFRLK